MPPSAETRAIGEAMAAIGAAAPGKLSVRRRARILAARVVRELLAMAERSESIEIILADLAIALEADPAIEIARNPDFALFAELERERCARFRTRNCRQLSLEEWRRETSEIAAILEARLAEKFRRECRIWEQAQDFPKLNRQDEAHNAEAERASHE